MAQLRRLPADAPAHISKSRNNQPFALQALALPLQHAGQKIYGTKARRRLPDPASAVGEALAGERAALRPACDPLVRAVEVANLPASDADIPGGHVGVGTDVAVKAEHEALAETHNLPAGFSPGVKVRAAGGPADGQAREGVFVCLLKAEELHHRGRYRGMEPQAALIGADGAGELHPVTVIGADLSAVVLPGDQKGEHALRLYHTGKEVQPFVAGVPGRRGNHIQPRLYRLQVLRLVGVLAPEVFRHPGNIVVHASAPFTPRRRQAWNRQP